jgi:phosphatidylglycerophosphate synthase
VSSPEGLGRLKEGYTVGVRRLAARSMEGLARTRVSPNALTATGVALCIFSGIIVYFEYRHELAAYWTGATLFTIGSIVPP